MLTAAAALLISCIKTDNNAFRPMKDVCWLSWRLFLRGQGTCCNTSPYTNSHLLVKSLWRPPPYLTMVFFLTNVGVIVVKPESRRVFEWPMARFWGPNIYVPTPSANYVVYTAAQCPFIFTAHTCHRGWLIKIDSNSRRHWLVRSKTFNFLEVTFYCIYLFFPFLKIVFCFVFFTFI